MPWEPITNVAQLIERVESSSLDYKTVYDLESARTVYEMAKDVAAFANAYGGAIIVGIDADTRTQKPAQIVGVSDIAALKQKLRDVLRTRCSPLPATPVDHVITVSPEDARRLLPAEAIPPSAPVELVTLNVAPDPRAPIGVRASTAKGDRIDNAWTFPNRIVDHTEFLNPTDLPMWMNNNERRVAIRLRALIGGAPRGVRIRVFHLVARWSNASGVAGDVRMEMSGGGMIHRMMCMTEVDETRGVVRFSQSDDEQGPVDIPIGSIDSVWTDVGDGIPSVAVAGQAYPDIAGERFKFKPYIR